MILYTLVLQFYFKNEQKQKTKWYLSEQKNRRKTKQCYHNDICRWNRDSFSSKVEITRGIVLNKYVKKIILKKL